MRGGFAIRERVPATARVALVLLLAGAFVAAAKTQGHSAGRGNATHPPPPKTRTRTTAQACPGLSRPDRSARCPYTAVAVVGRRAKGVLRVPEAIVLGSHGQVYV